jgi:hypothetical protein
MKPAASTDYENLEGRPSISAGQAWRRCDPLGNRLRPDRSNRAVRRRDAIDRHLQSERFPFLTRVGDAFPASFPQTVKSTRESVGTSLVLPVCRLFDVRHGRVLDEVPHRLRHQHVQGGHVAHLHGRLQPGFGRHLGLREQLPPATRGRGADIRSLWNFSGMRARQYACHACAAWQ